MLFALPGYQFSYIVMNRCLYLNPSTHELHFKVINGHYQVDGHWWQWILPNTKKVIHAEFDVGSHPYVQLGKFIQHTVYPL
jgi:hypothetical protein